MEYLADLLLATSLLIADNFQAFLLIFFFVLLVGVYFFLTRKALKRIKVRFFNFYPFDLYLTSSKEWSVINIIIIIMLVFAFGYLMYRFNITLAPA